MFIALAVASAILVPIFSTPLLAAIEAWTLSGTSTAALLARAVLVRHRNRARMRMYAETLSNGPTRLAGVRVLVTGATSGLGRGIAAHLALAGASLVLPYRRAMTQPELRAFVAESANEALRFSRSLRPALRAEDVDVLGVPDFDLASFSSIERAVAELERSGVRVGALVNNAGLVNVGGSHGRGPRGHAGLNFVGTAHWTRLLRARGVLARGGRVVLVGSEEHRQHRLDLRADPRAPPLGPGSSAEPLSWTTAMWRYGRSKLLLLAWAHELSRRAGPEGLAVWDVCPGPVASDIARDAPPLVAAAVALLLRLTFPSAMEAALPVVALAVEPCFAVNASASSPSDSRAGVHHHMSEPREAGGDAARPEVGAWAWAHAESLIAERGGAQA